MTRALRLSTFLLVLPPALAAQEVRKDSAGPLLYRGLPYGSQAYFSPLTVFLNKGFDHFQARNASRDVWRFPYRNALTNGAFDALLHPGAAIEHYPGWSKWLRTEVLPLTYTSTDARWFVNYSEHLVAGGLTYRMLGEWFAARGAPVPRLWAGITTFAAGIMNEAAEHPTAVHAASSSVADLYVFDLGGILLFNWDRPARFFAHTLQAADWSNLASLTFPDGELQNNGQYYIMKIPLPLRDTRLFLRGGMGAQVGLTRRVRSDRALSVALGMDTEVRNVDPVTRDETIRMAFGGGIYFDRNNSLLASLTLSPAANQLALNVYPGLLRGAAGELGAWAAYTRTGKLMAGIVSRHALGLGAGLGW